MCNDLDAAGGGARREAVANRLLGQRLQNEIGNQQIERRRVDGAPYFEPVREANLFDIEILVEVFHLPFEPNLLDSGAIEGEAQEIAEARNHAVRCLHITIHERGDSVQRVEQEMRLQLHLEHFELRHRQFGFELAGAQLAYTVAAIVFDAMANGEQGPGGEGVRMKFRDDDRLLGTEVDGVTDQRQQAHEEQQV